MYKAVTSIKKANLPTSTTNRFSSPNKDIRLPGDKKVNPF